MSAAPSLLIKADGTTVRFEDDGLRWQERRTVTRIPYGAVAEVSSQPARNRRVLLRVSLRAPAPGAPGVYELRCPARQGEQFAGALRRLAEEAAPPPGARPLPVTRLPLAEDAGARRERRTPMQWARRAMVVLFVLDSVVLLAEGRGTAAVFTWLGLPFWLLTPLAALGTAGSFGLVRDHLKGAVKVEGTLVARGTRETKNGAWPVYVYEFTDADSVRHRHEVKPVMRFARAKSHRTLWHRADRPDVEPAAYGDLVGFLVLGTVLAAVTLFLAAVGLLVLPGVLLGG